MRPLKKLSGKQRKRKSDESTNRRKTKPAQTDKARREAEAAELKRSVEEETRRKVEEDAKRVAEEARKMAAENEGKWPEPVAEQTESADYHVTTSQHARAAKMKTTPKLKVIAAAVLVVVKRLNRRKATNSLSLKLIAKKHVLLAAKANVNQAHYSRALTSLLLR